MDSKTDDDGETLLWLQENIDFLTCYTGLNHTPLKNLDLHLEKGDKNVTRCLGQKESNNQAVGFTATFVSGEIKQLSVFADMKDRFVWIQREKGNCTLREIVYDR